MGAALSHARHQEHPSLPLHLPDQAQRASSSPHGSPLKKSLVQLAVAAKSFDPVADPLGNELRVLPEAPHPGLPEGAEELPRRP